MFGRLLLLFLVVPLVELALLIQLGKWMGLLPTIGLVIVTGVAGAALARSQGAGVLFRIRQEMASGRMPMSDMLDGLLIFVAGALLLTPGLLTDLAGLSILVPGTRRVLKRVIGRRLKSMVESGRVHVVYGEPLP